MKGFFFTPAKIFELRRKILLKFKKFRFQHRWTLIRNLRLRLGCAAISYKVLNWTPSSYGANYLLRSVYNCK